MSDSGLRTLFSKRYRTCSRYQTSKSQKKHCTAIFSQSRLVVFVWCFSFFSFWRGGASLDKRHAQANSRPNIPSVPYTMASFRFTQRNASSRNTRVDAHLGPRAKRDPRACAKRDNQAHPRNKRRAVWQCINPQAPFPCPRPTDRLC